MKKPKIKHRSFASRLTWRIVLVQLCIMGLTSYLIYQITTSLLEEESTFRYYSYMNATKENIRRVLSDVYVASINNAVYIEKQLDRPDEMSSIMERMVRLNPHIHGCGLSFVDNYYPQKGRLFQPYAERTDSGVIVTRSLPVEDANYLDEKWFQQARDSLQGFWSAPFFAEGDSLTPLVSYLLPIRDKQGKTVAILGADLSLNWLKDRLADIDELTSELDIFGQKEAADTAQQQNSILYSFSFIIAKDGTYISHPEQKRILNKKIFDYTKLTPDNRDDSLAQRMVEGKDSHYYRNVGNITYRGSFESEETDYILIYSPIPYVNWSIGTAIPSLKLNLVGYALMFMLIFLITIALIVLFFMCRITIRHTARPLTKLSDSAKEVAKGNFDTPLPVIKHKDEIRLMRDSFEEMQQSLKIYVKELQETTAQKASIESELKVAHDIQMAMLPKIFPPYPERDDIDIFGTLTPAKGIGGDLFDFYIRDEQLFFCIGDVSGKGVPAALVMSTTRSLFRNISANVTEPNLIAKALNEAQSANNETNMFVTLFVGVLDLQTGHLCYCNAGHDSPLLIGQGVDILPCDPNLPIGVMADWEFTQQNTDIYPQTTIFLFTDGLNEAENINHQQFGDNRIHAMAEEMLSRQQHQPECLIEHMTAAVHTFVGGAEQSDDLTMLAIQYKKTSQKQNI